MHLTFLLLCSPYDFVGPTDHLRVTVTQKDGEVCLVELAREGDPVYGMLDLNDAGQRDVSLSIVRAYLAHIAWYEAARLAGWDGAASMAYPYGEEGRRYEVRCSVAKEG